MSDYDNEFDDAFAEADKKFKEKYKEVIGDLKGLSEEELNEILPSVTDREIYSKLIVMVQEATDRNIAIGELRQRVERLGESALTVVKKLPSLKNLFGV